MVLAIDFDGCVVEEAYPEIGELRKDAKKIINQLVQDGHYVIIWTCRTGEYLHKAELFLIENKIHYHKINQHHPKDLLYYKEYGPKIGADYYLDDKCIAGLPSWERIYKIINKRANESKRIPRKSVRLGESKRLDGKKSGNSRTVRLDS